MGDGIHSSTYYPISIQCTCVPGIVMNYFPLLGHCRSLLEIGHSGLYTVPILFTTEVHRLRSFFASFLSVSSNKAEEMEVMKLLYWGAYQDVSR